MLTRLILKLFLTIDLCVFATHALADYPDHPIRLIVPFAPAGTVDGIARLFANEFSKHVGQTVLVENKAGSGGVLGIVAASNAPADGYTLLLGNIATASSVALYPKAGINLKLLDPITLIGRSAYVLVVRNDFPAKNLNELIALLKAHPGKYNYASAGAGSAIHLAAELFKSKALVDILHVPYKGAGPALNALYSADVEMMFGSVSELKPQIITKKMRPIAVTSLSRSSALPDVPSFAESGIKDYDVPGWYGVYVPVRAPVEVLKRLREAADATLKSQGLQQLLKRYEMEPVLGGPREAGELLETEARRWSEVVNKANITAE
jgi:tripartite-type tricarboxylate transporter receptor subunit TctC